MVDKTNWDKVKWTPFQERTYDTAHPLYKKYKEAQNDKVFLNSIYQVEVTLYDNPKPFGLTVYLSLKTKDKQPRHDWREMQRIKNELVGEDVEAIELYPAEDRLVDTSNQYHLYCFPELDFPEHRFPFGYKDRLVAEGSAVGINITGKGSRQRDFRKELKPDDVVRSDVLDTYIKEGALVSGRCCYDNTPLVLREKAFTDIGGKPFLKLVCMHKTQHTYYLEHRNPNANDEDAKREGG